MGDNLHQRAVVREFMKSHEVWLETPWPSIYHDFKGLHLISKGSSLRTQAKNAAREAHLFENGWHPAQAKIVEVTYPPEMVRRHRSVLAAMSARCGVPVGDFRMPVPDDWEHGLLIPKGKPVLVFRPLVERREWGGCPNRNPDAKSYVDLFRSIRDRFFVVSVADLEPNKEWLAQETIEADIKLHEGQLQFRQLAALWRDASLVFTAPGFGVVLGQAVGTPVAAVFGGYESGYSFSSGAKHTPTLCIEPIEPCDCFSHVHQCRKTIEMAKAKRELMEFVDAHYPQP
ncbi:MAG TPA: hypothetical protein VIK69_09145 [Methylophilaceae bacterium]